MPRPATASRKNRRRHASLPGVLQSVLHRRYLEFRYPSFPPYALELICFDLRLRRAHDLTLVFANATESEQDALNQLLARHYVAGPDARGLLLRAINGEPIPDAPPLSRGDRARWREYVHYSEALAPCIDARWEEAGYSGFSAYLTALIRYDLLLLGPHKHFNGDDWGAARMAELDAKTVKAFHERKLRTLFLDHEFDRAAGRALTPAERSARMREIAQFLLEYAVAQAR